MKELLWLLLTLSASIHCNKHDCGSKNSLIVDTTNGKVRGNEQYTFFHGTKYISFLGIPYAEPPIGDLRFQEPVPKGSWSGVLETSGTYSNACISFSALEIQNLTFSEDCLYLNVYKPEKIPNCEKLPVMFYIHGGGFTEGDGSSHIEGPDHLMENELGVILVTINYRLGPFGFMNLDIPDCSGNQGLKDQRLALKWVYKNIERFGGNKELITLIGQSAGGSSVHFHLLSPDSHPYFKRAICMSGTVFSSFATPEDRNQKSMLLETFRNELSNVTNDYDILQYLKKASIEEIDKLPRFDPDIVKNGPLSVYWGPFLTESPIDIIKTTKLDKDVMFGFTSLEFVWFMFVWSEIHAWVDPLNQDFSIMIPVRYTESLRNTEEYKKLQAEIREFYFGNRTIEKNSQDLYIYLKMVSALNFDLPTYKAVELHAGHSTKPTFFYEFDMDLNLNYRSQSLDEIRKAQLNGVTHCDDLRYLFRQQVRHQLYENVKSNLNDPMNRKILEATKLVSGFHAEFAKTGKVYDFKPASKNEMNCVKITNQGLQQTFPPNEKEMRFWSELDRKLRKLIT